MKRLSLLFLLTTAAGFAGCVGGDEVTCQPERRDGVTLNTMHGGTNQTLHAVAYWCFPPGATIEGYDFSAALPDGATGSFAPTVADAQANDRHDASYWLPAASGTPSEVNPRHPPSGAAWLVFFERWEPIADFSDAPPRFAVMWYPDASGDPGLLPEGPYELTVALRDGSGRALTTPCLFERGPPPRCER